MASIELLVLSVLRTLVEVAGMFLLAQGVLYLLAGASRSKNVIYQIFSIVTRPVITATRFLAPRIVLDRHIPFVAFFMLFWLWILLAYVRQVLCETNGLVCG